MGALVEKVLAIFVRRHESGAFVTHESLDCPVQPRLVSCKIVNFPLEPYALSATSRSSFVSLARYTSPTPPLADEGGDIVVAEPEADVESHGWFGLICGSFYAQAVSGSRRCTEIPTVGVRTDSAGLRVAVRWSGSGGLAGRLWLACVRVGSVKTAWRAACRRAGIDDLNFHDLRREAGSRLLEGGMPEHYVQRFLDHANPSTTSRYLATTRRGMHQAFRLYEQRQAQEAGKVCKLFARKEGSTVSLEAPSCSDSDPNSLPSGQFHSSMPR